MNILKEANAIVNERSEEKERQYGPFGEGMERAASIASGMTGKTFTGNDMFAAMIALKFSRESYNHKDDNLLDAAAYLGAWQNYIEEIKESQKKVPTFPDDLKVEIKDDDSSNGVWKVMNEWRLMAEENGFPLEKDLSKAEDILKSPSYSEYLADPKAAKISYSEYFAEKNSAISTVERIINHIITHLESKLDAVTKIDLGTSNLMRLTLNDLYKVKEQLNYINSTGVFGDDVEMEGDLLKEDKYVTSEELDEIKNVLSSVKDFLEEDKYVTAEELDAKINQIKHALSSVKDVPNAPHKRLEEYVSYVARTLDDAIGYIEHVAKDVYVRANYNNYISFEEFTMLGKNFSNKKADEIKKKK